MIYSVWNQGKGVYDYYQTPDVQEVANAPKPGHLRATNLGMTPAQAAWPLPAGAQKIGSGEYARGRVAIQKIAGLGSYELGGVPVTWLIVGALAFVVWRRHR